MEGNTMTLAPGEILNSGEARYRVVEVLGQGGFGITYLVYGEMKIGNVTAEAKFAIKEHFPGVFCKREGSQVRPQADKYEEFNRSKADFIAEARKLHALGSECENIVKVNEVFEANGTAYYVMQYINGQSLTSYINKCGKLPYSQAIELLLPILNAVEFLHGARINHLDIKPDNIMLHEGMNGISPILIDFGQCVHFKKNGEKTSPKGVQGVSEGYSPLEQYAGITEFIPAADIYSLMATLLHMLTGATPKGAAELRMADVKATLVKAGVPDDAITGICKAMNKSSDDRTQSVALLKADLGLSGGNSANITQVLAIQEQELKRKNNLIKIGGAALVVVIIGLLFALFRSPSTGSPDADEVAVLTDSVSEEIAEVLPAQAQPAASAVANVEEAKPAKEEATKEKPEAASNSKKSEKEILREAIAAYDARNYSKAVTLFREISHNAEAQYYLGVCYLNGTGVTQSKNIGVQYYRRAAQNGDVRAQYWMGLAYEHGNGVTRSDKEALNWYIKAANQGSSIAASAKKRLERELEFSDENDLNQGRINTGNNYNQSAYNNNQTSNSYDSNHVFTAVEVSPQFPGGETAMYKWVEKNIRYPEPAAQNNIQGRVTVQFVVEKNGYIGEVKVVRGKDPDLDAEAVRVVRSMPRFNPGKMNGQPVRVWYTLPINFKLQK